MNVIKEDSSLPSVEAADLLLQNATVFVGDLSVFCTEQDLQNLFEPFGLTKDIRIIRENKSNQPLSYGFVEYLERESALNAMNTLNGELFKGRCLRISWATTSSTKMNPRKSTASPSEISTSPAPFLPYQPKTDSESSISSPHPSLNKPTRSPITQQSDENIPTVQILFSFLSNQIENVVTEEFVRDLFEEFGAILDVNIKKIKFNKAAKTQNGYGFVHYCCTRDGVNGALQAVTYFHKRQVQDVKFDCKVSHQFQQFLDHDRIIQAGNNQYHNQGHGTWNGNRNGNNAHSAQGGPRQQSTTYYESHMSNMGGPPAHQHQQQQHDSYPQSHQQMQQQMHHNEQMYQQANYSAMQNMQTHSLQPMMQNGPFQMSSSPPSTTFQPIQHQSAAMYYGQLMGQPPMNGRHMNQSPAYIPAQNQFQQQNPPIPPMSTMSPIQGMQGVPSMPIQQGSHSMVMQPYQNLVQMMPYMYHPQNSLPSGYPPVAFNHNMLPPNLPTPLPPQDQHQYEMKSVNTMQYTGNYENSNSSNHVHNPNIVQRFPNAGSGYTNHNNHA